MKSRYASFRFALVVLLGTCTGALASGCAEQESRGASPSVTNAGTLRFTDITEAAGLAGFTHQTGAAGDKYFPESMGSGCGFIDYDQDGWIDILLVGGGEWEPETKVRALRLFRNNGDGTFSETTEAAGLHAYESYAQGVTVADYDNDGDDDIFLTSIYQDLLFRNDGGTFTEVGEEAGVRGGPTWSSSAVFFDADRDGWADLYVAKYVHWSPEMDVWCSLNGRDKDYCTPEVYEGATGRYFHNNGDGTFSDLTKEAGFVEVPGYSLGVSELDFNRDGWPDLVVANDQERNLLFVNDGDGTFTERGMRSGIAFDHVGRARAGMGIDAGVADRTGEVSIFVGNFSNEMIGVYRHIRDGLFVDRSAVSQIGRASLKSLTFGLFLFDADLDGDPDLFAANGHVQMHIAEVQDGMTYRQSAQLFINKGDGTFDDGSHTAGEVFSRGLVARGAAYADVDNDGDLDVLVTENDGPAHLWRNEIRSGRLTGAPAVNGTRRDAAAAQIEGTKATPHVLRVRVLGRRSNRDGLGVRLVAVAGGRRLERRVRTGSSYLSQSERVVTFGLGTATRVDSLHAYWPSGVRQSYTSLDVDQEILIEEGAALFSRGEKTASSGRAHVSGRGEP